MADLNELEQIRLEKLARLKASGKEAYPGRVHRTHTTAEAIQAFEGASDGPQTEIEVVGRLRSIRRMGKVTFAHIEDGAGRLQLYLRADDLGQPEVTLFNDVFDLGDFVQARGTMFRTKTGEATLHVGVVGMLAKAISSLPAATEE